MCRGPDGECSVRASAYSVKMLSFVIGSLLMCEKKFQTCRAISGVRQWGMFMEHMMRTRAMPSALFKSAM